MHRNGVAYQNGREVQISHALRHRLWSHVFAYKLTIDLAPTRPFEAPASPRLHHTSANLPWTPRPALYSSRLTPANKDPSVLSLET